MPTRRTRAGRKRWTAGVVAAALVAFAAGNAVLNRYQSFGSVAPRLDVEDLLPDGSPYTPATQSFLRGHHWLDSVAEIAVRTSGGNLGHFELRGGSDGRRFELRNVPLDYLVPRLFYAPRSPPDQLDAFNLMLAEYSRNGLNMAAGERGEPGAHFETDLVEARPWVLAGDFRFVPNPEVRPLRVAVVNNCLGPGLWEVVATDRAGEIHHSWLEFPEELYYALVAAANGVDEAFARRALEWRAEPVEADFDRLRRPGASLGEAAASLVEDSEVGYSSQGSRRKLAGGFALVGDDGDLRRPEYRGELTAGPVHLSDFVAPGKYSLSSKRRFDLSFLARPGRAEVRRVRPLTRYDPDRPPADGEYLEIDLELDGHRLVIGNLPVARLVPQEDFTISGFGVGVLPDSHLAERRQLLFERGPAPSYAYLVRREGGRDLVLNSHEHGLEQIFVRTHSLSEEPWWEITVTSFERIVDLVKYRLEIPAEMHEQLAAQAREYVSPLYLSYRDDRIR